MSAEETPGQGGEDELADFVPAVFARSMEEAEAYRRLLDDHDIPAILGLALPVDRSALITRGCPVLVPEVMLDDASRVIAERWPGGSQRGRRPVPNHAPASADVSARRCRPRPHGIGQERPWAGAGQALRRRNHQL